MIGRRLGVFPKGFGMKIFLKVSAVLLLLGGFGAPAYADQALCDCLVRCDKLYAEGTFQHEACMGQCQLNYGPGLCRAPVSVKADRLMSLRPDHPAKASPAKARKL
jgi:hypothetical protein